MKCPMCGTDKHHSCGRPVGEIQKEVRYIQRQIANYERRKQEAYAAIRLYDSRIKELTNKLPKLVKEARAGFDNLAEELGIEDDEQ